MNFSDYAQHDALGLAALVASGQVSDEELLETAIASIEMIDPALRAITQKLYDHARIELENVLPQGPFRGVPFLLKDAGILLAGTPNFNGCGWFDAVPADHDSTLTVRYKSAGLVILGKTSTPELGLAVTTEPKRFGPTHNPWNLDYSTGGSSGGAAAAVCSGMMPAVHASDGGGSIRIPASCCGLFGLKPTRGRIPVGPDRGEVWSGLAVAHALTRSVRDSAALLDATAGAEAGDPYFSAPRHRPYLTEVGTAPGRLRIAYSAKAQVPVHADCVAALEDAVSLCAELGHEVEEVSPPIDPVDLTEVFLDIAAANIASGIDEVSKQLGKSYAATDFEAPTWAMIQRATSQPMRDYATALNTIHRAGRIAGQFHSHYDIFMCPTLAQPPQKLGVLSSNSGSTASYIQRVFSFSPFTATANMTGQPSASVPMYWNAQGLPIGVMFTAGFGEEGMLFRLAGQLEQARPWAQRIPPTHITRVNR